MDFGNALNALRAGHKVARGQWVKGLWIEIRDDKIKMASIRMGNMETWSGHSEDLLATDWEIVDG
jgi:hypothetical protein